MTFPIRNKLNGGVVGLFNLELLPYGPMPPLEVLPTPPTLLEGPDTTLGIDYH